MQVAYALEPEKRLRPTYVRVRCPCCGMLARLDNLKRDHKLLEECDTFCLGDRNIQHRFVKNEALRPIWIQKMAFVLAQWGYRIELLPMPYSIHEYRPSDYLIKKELEEVIRYGVQEEREIAYPTT